MSAEVQIALLVIVSLMLAVLVGGVAWFVIARVWPHVTRQFELTREHRLHEQEQFLVVMGAQVKTAEGTRQLMGQMQEILSLQTGAIQRLADEIARAQKRRARTPKKEIP